MPSRVLVVDDERLIRWSLEQTLEKLGYDVETAEDGARAVAAVREESPDLLLLDLKLPDTDGIQVLRQVKESHPDIQVIIMTAYADVGTAVEAMRLGAYDYVAKPIDFENLGVTLRNALETRQLRQKVEFLREKHLYPYHFGRLVGTSRAIQEVVSLARKVSVSGATTLLIQGRERDRQGCPRQGSPLRERSRRRIVHGDHLHGDAGDAARVGAVRPRAGRLHRCQGAEEGAAGAGAWRDDLLRLMVSGQ